MAFAYVAGTYSSRRKLRPMVEVKPALTLDPNQRLKAQATIDLVDLNAIDERPNVSNLRWKFRLEAWKTVSLSLQDYETIKADPACAHILHLQANQIARTAKGTGFFSIWFAAFRNHPEVLRLLLDQAVFLGTATTCFDPTASYQPVFRNPGNALDPM